MKNTFILSIFIISAFSCSMPKTYQVNFKLDMSGQDPTEPVYLQGDVAPLSWKEGYAMKDEDGDGTYEAELSFTTKKNRLQYKFRQGTTWELDGADNRQLWFQPEPQVINQYFDEYEYYKAEKIAQLTYSAEQIKEDVAVLRKTIAYVHPNLFRFRSKAEIERDFQQLESDLLAEPTLVNAYKQISRFASKIQCSHTFTNPWNQGSRVKKTIFYQPDKLPFTFQRIAQQIFIDKNASEEEALQAGLEVLAINGVTTQVILERLMPYISADGANDEKRLNRLTISGNEKFELFDIFYPLEFGSAETFKLKLLDHNTGKILMKEVKAISKTRRDANLRSRYPDFKNDFASGWQFDWKDDSTAYLKMQSFAIFDNSFDWKGFINRAFAEIKAKNGQHLILDIRGNEGGNDEIVEHLLLQFLQRPLTLPAPQSIVNYKRLPEELRPHVSTWEKLPYNWGATLEQMPNGQYRMKERFSGRAKTYSPVRDHFTGETYLLVDAANSSATQIMATYAKAYDLATVVGQPTGGNQRGLTGGFIFFHRLPNTGVEIDLPLIGITLFPVDENTPNEGVQPDVIVEKNIEDFINGVDTELKTTIRLIRNGSISQN